MNKKILLLSIALMTAACAPRHDEGCMGHTLKHCEPAVYFALNSDQLDAKSTQTLGWVVDKMKRWPDRTVLISGNTDLQGDAAYNQALSLRRAEAVKSYLVKKGVAANRIKTRALGKQEPLTQDTKQQNMNRRVDITFGHEDHRFLAFLDNLCEDCSDSTKKSSKKIKK